MPLSFMQELIIREFSFHQLNANLLWLGTFAFAKWLVQHWSCIEGRCAIELGRYINYLYINLCLSYSYYYLFAKGGSFAQNFQCEGILT